MSGFRKVIGLLIIIFIGIPVLFGIIWGVGVTKAVVSPEFLSELPQDIISKIPVLLDETLEAVDQEGVVEDAVGRIWVRAIADADTSPKELLEKIGVMDWLQNELSNSIGDIGKILRGEMRLKPIMLNLRPLKAALVHPDLDPYLLEILKKLPPCTTSDMNEWIDAVMQGNTMDDLPPCQPPDPEKAVALIRKELEEEVQEMPDEVDIFRVEGRHYFRDSGLDIARTVVSFTYLLFLIPAFFIGIGALIGARNGSGVLRWIGYSSLIGGGITFLFSRFTGKLVTWGVGIGPTPYYDVDLDFPMSEVIFDKAGDIALVVVDHLLAAVNSVSGTVAIVGIVLIALSYLSTSSTPRTQSQGPAPQSPQPPQNPPAQPVQPTSPTPQPAPEPTPTPEPQSPPAINGEGPKPAINGSQPPALNGGEKKE
jgi:hypothetical protein